MEFPVIPVPGLRGGRPSKNRGPLTPISPGSCGAHIYSRGKTSSDQPLGMFSIPSLAQSLLHEKVA